MDLRELQKHWDQFGDLDPMWAILTLDDKRNGQWDLADFFATGRNEIDRAINHLLNRGILNSCYQALDFGCGIGRLTQALCHHFDRVVGVDIAPSMLKLANECNQHPDKCQYVLNHKDDLSIFSTGQ